MRIHVLCDLHIEFAPFVPPKTQADVVILAGDTHVGIKGIHWARECFPDTPVVYVVGNHEFYRHNHPRLIEKLRGAALGSNVAVLEKGVLEIGGISFLGCTLWASLALFGDPFLASSACADVLTDFKLIRVAPQYRKMRPSDMTQWHRTSVEWLAGELEARLDSPCVVVTHHAPSARSLGEEPAADPTSAAFASDLESLIQEFRPALWIHGHVHRAFDYTLGSTRVLCNSRGYPEEKVEGFNPWLIVTVP
jgi:Icc-related predicted phosphoesterase